MIGHQQMGMEGVVTALGGPGRTARPPHCYNFAVSSKLTSTNPYLRDPAMRERSVLKSVASSSAIEGIRAPFRRKRRAAVKASGATRAKSTRRSRITRA